MRIVSLLTCALLLTPAAQAQLELEGPPGAQAITTPRALLAGTTDRLRWTLYSPGPLPEADENEVHLVVPEGSRALGTKYLEPEQTAVVAFRSPLEFEEVFEVLDRQLQRQGYERTEDEVEGNEISAVYERVEENVRLRVVRTGEDVYHAFLRLGAGPRYGPTRDPHQGTVVPDRPFGPPFIATAFDGVLYQIYGPGLLGDLRRFNDRVRISLPPESVLGEETIQDAEAFVVTFRSELPIADVYAHFERQLLAQGFERGLPEIFREGDYWHARYGREGAFLELGVRLRESAGDGDVYVMELDTDPD